MKKCPKCSKHDADDIRFCKDCGAELFFANRFEQKHIKAKSQTIRITSKLPESAEKIWSKLQEISTLQYIAIPYATFKPVKSHQVFTWGRVTLLNFS